MLRTSSYTIYVDLPSEQERMLLVHGYTGAYDLVSRGVATYVRSLERRRPPKPLYGTWTPEPEAEGRVPMPSDETLEALQRRGYLTQLSFDQEEDFFTRITHNLHERSRTPGYVFVTDYNCNLRCPYCFQSHMREDASFCQLLGAMRREVIDRIFRAIRKIEDRHGLDPEEKRFRSYGLFGGEPLLRASRGSVEYIFEKARDLGPCSFFTISNGTEIDAYEDLIGPEGIGFFQITFDGAPPEHDKRRVYADGRGSYERIADNIDMALERGAVVSVRVNIDRNNLDQVVPLAAEIRKRGWDKHKNFHVYVAAIRAENDHTDAEQTFGTWDLHHLMHTRPELRETLSIVNPPDDRIKRQAHRIFNRDPKARPAMRASFCGANDGMYLFDSFGDIYPCWERLGEQRFRIGHIVDDSGEVEFYTEVFDQWRGRNVASNPACLRCRYALYCGGGCAVQAEEVKGKFFINACDGFRSRFRASLAEAYEDFRQGINYAESHAGGCER